MLAYITYMDPTVWERHKSPFCDSCGAPCWRQPSSFWNVRILQIPQINKFSSLHHWNHFEGTWVDMVFLFVILYISFIIFHCACISWIIKDPIESWLLTHPRGRRGPQAAPTAASRRLEVFHQASQLAILIHCEFPWRSPCQQAPKYCGVSAVCCFRTFSRLSSRMQRYPETLVKDVTLVQEFHSLMPTAWDSYLAIICHHQSRKTSQWPVLIRRDTLTICAEPKSTTWTVDLNLHNLLLER